MPPEDQQPNNTEPLLANILENQDKHHKITHDMLGGILHHNEKTRNENTSLAENQLEVTDKILKAVENKPEIQKVELMGAEIVTIKGQKGDKGDKGDQGGQGIQGEKGDKGSNSVVPGPEGKQGQKGDKGDKGEAIMGPMGLDGPEGPEGKQGQPGKNGINGSPDTALQIVKKLSGLINEERLSFNDLKDTPLYFKQPNLAGTGYLREISDVSISNLQNGQVLQWNSTTNKWENKSGGVSASPLTTKGDIYGFSTTNARIPVGTDGQILTADSTQALGVKWGTAGAGTPAGLNTDVQYNDSGSFGGDSNFQWDKVNKRLLLGGVTTATNATLHIIDVTSGGDPHGITEDHYSDDTNNGSLTLRKARGTQSAPTAVLSGDFLGTFNWYGFDGVAWDTTSYGNQARIRVQTTENWAPGAHGADMYFITTAAGSTAFTKSLHLQGGGNVGIGMSLTSTPGALLDLGLAGTTLGVARFAGSTSGNVSLQPNAIAGTNIVLTLPPTTGTLVIGGGTASGTNTGDQNLFSSVVVSGQTTVTVNSTTTALTLVAGTNVTITTDNTAKSLTINASGGGGSPGGSNTQVQYNNSGSFGGIVGVTTDGTILTVASGDFQLAGSGSGTTILNASATASGTLTLPAATDTLVARATTDTLSNKTLNNTNAITVKTGSFTLQDTTDTTKQATFDASGISTASTRVYTLPNKTGTIALLNGTQTWAGTQTFGSGVLIATSPSFTTPTLGVATATSINKVTITAPATGSTLTIADGKTLTVNNSLTLAGTDGTTMTFPSTSATLARTDAANTFTGVQTFISTPILSNNSISFTGDVSGTATLQGPHSGGGTLTLPAGTHTLLAADGSGASLTNVVNSITGTANQVIASASTGAVTLSLPQSIATSSTPQFAKIGIGAAADANRLLYVTGNISGGVATIERTNSSTNAVLGTVIIKGTSTGTMADGFGSAFQFAIEDTTAVENIIGNIQMFRDGANNSGKMAIQTSNAGVLNNAVTIDHLGAVTMLSTLLVNQTATIGTAGGGTGLLNLSGITSGTIGITTASAAGTWTLTLPTSGGTNGFVLQTNGSGVTSWVAQSGGGVSSVSGTTNRVTSTGGTTPVIDISASYVGQSSITTLGTVTTGIWNGSLIDLAHGGTNNNLTASNGGIVYSNASTLAILAGTATAGQIIMSGASTTPSWSTATYPATAGTAGNVLTSDGTNWASSAPSGTTPVIKLVASTMFETAARFGTNNSTGTLTFDTEGLTLDTTTSTTAFCSAILKMGNNQTNLSMYAGSPIFSMMISQTQTTGNMNLTYMGLGTPTVSSSGITYTPRHIGFELDGNGLLASMANGTSRTSSTMVASGSVALNDVWDLICVVGTSSADYYQRHNSGSLSAKTTISSNFPTATSASDAQATFSAAQGGTGHTGFNISSFHYTR